MSQLVCYCFQHSEESIRDEIVRTGRSTVVERVTAEIRANRCDCENLNPSGKCCLGDVRRAVKAALAEAGRDAEITVSSDSSHDCCASS